jgi:hypothetical protein
MIQIECKELTNDEQLALAAAISDALGGQAIALVKGNEVVVDALTNGEPDLSQIEAILDRFISKRKDSQHYHLDRSGTSFYIHSPDPLARARGRKKEALPENLLKCPWCAFVTPYEEVYSVHCRAHGFSAPAL